MPGNAHEPAAAEADMGPGWGAVAGGEGQCVWTRTVGGAGMEVIPPCGCTPGFRVKDPRKSTIHVCHSRGAAGGVATFLPLISTDLCTKALWNEISDTISCGGALVST